MAWVAEENFDSYSDGNLAGGNGGSGWSAAWANSATAVMSVQGTTTYQGAKAVSYTHASLNSFYTRNLTSGVSGAFVMYVALRRTATNAGNLSFTLRNIASGGRCGVQFNSSGNIVASDGTSVLAGYSANQWYVLRITGNTTGGTYTIAYNTGSGWSAESGTATMTNSGNIDRVGMSSDAGSVTDYYDTITASDPVVPATSIKTINGLAKASVKTKNGLANASIKTFNGLA